MPSTCPILRCWANFPELESSCIFQYLKRNEVSLYDLTLLTKYDKEQLDTQFEHQRRLVAAYLKLLQELEHPAPTSVCSDCGILREAPGRCLNQVNCIKRQQLYQRQLQVPPLSHYELEISPAHFYAIFTSEEFATFLDDQCVDPETLKRASQQQLRIQGVDLDPSDLSD